MPRLDERLRGSLERLAPSVEPASVDRIAERKRRYRLRRRVGSAALTIAVLSGSIGGVLLLSRAFDERPRPGAVVPADTIAFRRGRSIATIPAAGGTPKTLVRPGGPGKAGAYGPRWSPDGRRLLISTIPAGDALRSLPRILNATGDEIENLADVLPSFVEPGGSWSPDGRDLLIAAGEDFGSHDVMLIPEMGEPQRLTTYEGYDGQPAWSPDGSTIAFTSDRGGSGLGIYLMDADGGHVRAIADDPDLQETDPAWSPDGTGLAYSAAERAPIYAKEYDISGVDDVIERDTAHLYRYERGPVRFLLDAPPAAGLADIHVVDLTTGRARAVTDHPADDFQPAWSPDGERIAFVSSRAARDDGGAASVIDGVVIGEPSRATNTELFVMNADGTGVRRLTRTLAPEFEPDWSPSVTAPEPAEGASGRDLLLEVPVEGIGSDLTVGHGAVWIADNRDRLRQIDPATGSQSRAIVLRPVEVLPHAVVATDEWIFVGGSGRGVLRVDPDSGDVTRTDSRYSNVLAADGTLLWNQAGGGAVELIDPETGRVEFTIQAAEDVGDLNSRATRDLVAGFGSAWLADGTTGEVVRIDATAETTRIRIGPAFERLGEGRVRMGAYAQSMAVGGGRVWACCDDRGRIVPIDPERNAPAGRRIPVPGSAGDPGLGDVEMVWANGYLWISDCCPEAIQRLDPATGEALLVTRTKPFAERMVAKGGRLWALGSGDTIQRWLVSFRFDDAEKLALLRGDDAPRRSTTPDLTIAVVVVLAALVVTGLSMLLRRRRPRGSPG